MTNPYFLPCTIDGAERPPLVEVWPACRPTLTSSDPHDYGLHHRRVEGWCFYNEQRAEFYDSVMDYQARALTRCAVMEACGKALGEQVGVARKLEWAAAEGYRRAMGRACLNGDDARLNELAHRLHMETTR